MDRCTTCHMGVEDPRFGDAPQPFRTHPAIPKHPFEKIGCSACHGGQPLATTTRDAHGRVPFWEEPLLEQPYREAPCGACHLGADLPGAPILAQGRQLYLQSGRIACHRIRGVGGIVGPDLTFVGGRRHDPEWHLRHLREPQAVSPGSAMPPLTHLPESEIKALTVYLLSLREMPSALLAAPIPAVAAPTSRGAAAPPAATDRPTGTTRASASRAGNPALTPDAPARLDRAKALYGRKSCAACHTIGGVGGQVGPDLTAEGTKPDHDVAWHLKHFRNPPAVIPGSIMPPLDDMTEDDLKVLAEYMLSLRGIAPMIGAGRTLKKEDGR